MYKQVISIVVITHDEVNNRINHYVSSLSVRNVVRRLSNVSKYELFYLNPLKSHVFIYLKWFDLKKNVHISLILKIE